MITSIMGAFQKCYTAKKITLFILLFSLINIFREVYNESFNQRSFYSL